MNGFTLKHLAFSFFTFFIIFYSSVFAADVVSETFTAQTASFSGSNGSYVSVGSYLDYVNKGGNSSIIGNYFSGYFYDDMYGFFVADWSGTANQNVRITGSTGACPSGYGYKLGGYGYSEDFGFIDFDYNSSIFVYYCLEDNELHGYSYSSDLGFQSFEGITFNIDVVPEVEIPDIPTGTGTFTDDGTDITDDSGDSGSGDSINSNFNPNSIQADIIEFDTLNESLFYIIK